MQELIDHNASEMLQILKDPFCADKITAIHIHAYPQDEGFRWNTAIEFKNGQTEGKQRFKADNFEGIASQIKTFLESLNKE